MRQSSQVLNPNIVDRSVSDEQLTYLSSKGLIADLAGVRVDIFGVDNVGKDLEYWNALHTYWQQYFENAHACLKQYSILDR